MSPIDPMKFDISAWPSLPKVRGLFVTATDTEVGKTLIAGAIARQLRRLGMNVEVFKPAATGCKHGRGGLVSGDADFLAACAESRRTLSEITPVRYVTAVAPNVAARREHRPIDLEAIFESYRNMARLLEQNNGVAVVEGIGGLLCPISDAFWVVHFAKLTRLPVVIVSRAGLGSVNHVLLTLQAARCAGLKVAGVVVNRYQLEPPAGPQKIDPQEAFYRHGDADLAMFTNPQQIAQLGKVEVLAIVPDEAANSVERATVGSNTEFAIGQVDWLGLMDR